MRPQYLRKRARNPTGTGVLHVFLEGACALYCPGSRANQPNKAQFRRNCGSIDKEIFIKLVSDALPKCSRQVSHSSLRWCARQSFAEGGRAPASCNHPGCLVQVAAAKAMSRVVHFTVSNRHLARPFSICGCTSHRAKIV
eukprot:5374432-Amphidinium_carterae.3